MYLLFSASLEIHLNLIEKITSLSYKSHGTVYIILYLLNIINYLTIFLANINVVTQT